MSNAQILITLAHARSSICAYRVLSGSPRGTPAGGHRRYGFSKLRPELFRAADRAKRKTVGYGRVSSHDQKPDLERQKQVLELFCARQGWTFDGGRNARACKRMRRQGTFTSPPVMWCLWILRRECSLLTKLRLTRPTPSAAILRGAAARRGLPIIGLWPNGSANTRQEKSHPRVRCAGG